jgi:AraC family transcriptional regulator
MSGRTVRTTATYFMQPASHLPPATKAAPQPYELARAARLMRSVLDDLHRQPKAIHRRLTEVAGILGVRVEPAPARGPRLAPWTRASVLRHIEEHLDTALRVPVLAEVAGLSPSHFCRAFKATFGAPVHLFITRMRLQHAMELMQSTSMALSEIALASGFCDQSHMCNCFRRIHGESPGRVRRQRKTPMGAHAADH